jgi:RNA polymerase sigma-70 factor, ECF subfamily
MFLGRASRVTTRSPIAKRYRSTPEAALSRLIGRISLGDQAAFASFYDATSPTVFGLALSAFDEQSKAESVTLDAYVGAWTAAPTFDPAQEDPTAWLQSIAARSIARRRALG